MLFIVIWHSIIHGIMMSKNVDLTNLSQIEIGNYIMIQLLTLLTSISVNCFVLISGYFSINSKQVNYDRIIKIWFQTFFYSIIIYLLLSSIGIIPFKFITTIKTLLPICTTQYWFITMYIPLMLIGPYISKIIKGNSKKDNIKILLIFSFMTLTFISLTSKGLYFPLGKLNTVGYNFIWFIYLYIVGGYIKLYEPFTNHTKLLCYIVTILLIFLSIAGTLIYLITRRIPFFLICYNGFPFIFSVIFFLIIKNIKLNTNNAINKILIKIAPYTFGVYLIHDNSFIRNILWYKNLFQFGDYFNTYYFILYLLSISILIFSVCVTIDKMRSLLFKSLQIDKGVKFTRTKLSETFNHLYYKFINQK